MNLLLIDWENRQKLQITNYRQKGLKHDTTRNNTTVYLLITYWDFITVDQKLVLYQDQNTKLWTLLPFEKHSIFGSVKEQNSPIDKQELLSIVYFCVKLFLEFRNHLFIFQIKAPEVLLLQFQFGFWVGLQIGQTLFLKPIHFIHHSLVSLNSFGLVITC